MSRIAAGVLVLLAFSCGDVPEHPAIVVDWLAPGRLLNALPASVELRPADLLTAENLGFLGRTEEDDEGSSLLWAAEHRARVQLELSAASRRTLTLDARSPSADAVELTVVWDGEIVEKLLWEGRRSTTMQLPGSVDARSHRLDLYVDRLQRSDDDPRERGLAIYALRIDADRKTRGIWRWMPRDVASELHIESRAQSFASSVLVLESIHDGDWTVLERFERAAEQPFDRVVRLDATERRAPSRIAVVGAGDWTTLRQTSRPRGELERRDLLLITLDTTRRDALGFYRAHDTEPTNLGVEESPTPQLDEWARQSRVFDMALSPSPVTAPTHASLFLSQAPAEHGLVNNGQSLPLSSGSNLTALLQAWGYEAAGFVSLGVLGADAGFARNFAHFDDALGENWSRPAAGVNAALSRWLVREPVDAPRFLWLHYSDPHFPYGDVDSGGGVLLELGHGETQQLPSNGGARRFSLSAPPGRHRIALRAPEDRPGFAQDGRRYNLLRLRTSDERAQLRAGEGFAEHQGVYSMLDEAELELTVAEGAPPSFEIEIGVAESLPAIEKRRRYAADVQRMDGAIEAAWEQLRAVGWKDDTIIWVAGDHGEDLGLEDGRFGHVQHVRPPLSRVPLFVLDRRSEPIRVDEPVGIVDIAPSIASSVGLEPLPAWRGENLLRPIEARRALHLESFPPESPEHWRAFVRGRYKVEGRLDVDGTLASPLRVFNLENDPNCQTDLTGENGLGDALLIELAAEWGVWPGHRGGDAAEPDAAMEERLRALGYLD